jgi:DNA-binding MarR family transcriptional regulator
MGRHAAFPIPCACGNLRRLTRLVTRLYDAELRSAGLEVNQYGLLSALAQGGELGHQQLSAGFAMDSTTLTRTLGVLRRNGWITVRSGADRRQRLYALTDAGRDRLRDARPGWLRAQKALRAQLGEAGWRALTGDAPTLASRVAEIL